MWLLIVMINLQIILIDFSVLIIYEIRNRTRHQRAEMHERSL